MSGALARFADFVKHGPWGMVNQNVPVPLTKSAYVRSVQDQQPRLSLQTLSAEMFVAAASQMTLGNPSPMARLYDAMFQTDPEIRAAMKQLKTAIAGVEFVVTPPNDSKKASMIAQDLDEVMEQPKLDIRNLKGWIVEGRVRGGGLIEAVWNDPKASKRLWERFVVVPQQRMRLNRVTGEMQFAQTPYTFQGTDVSEFPLGKWIVIQPDQHIQDFALRGIAPALLNDWFSRMNVMGWWNQAIERDAMKTLVGKAGSDADAAAMKEAFQNRGAAGSFLMRDQQSSVSALEGTVSRSGISPYGEFMSATAHRLFLALLGESQTGIAAPGGKQTAAAQQQVAAYVIQDVCNDIAHIVARDLFAAYVELNYGPENLVNCPAWIPKLKEPVDVAALNEAISTRPANVPLGIGWYREQTQWPEPDKGEELLAEPMPMPGQYPADQKPA